LITTRSGFLVTHDVFEGNTLRVHTMMGIAQRFQQRVGDTKPVIMADAAMLSRANTHELASNGYRYIVGVRLANTTRKLTDRTHLKLPHTRKALTRFENVYTDPTVALICEFSQTQCIKNKREFDKQVQRSHDLLTHQEPGRRAKFVKKANKSDRTFEFDVAHQATAKKLLGIKGYVTNLSKQELSNTQVVAYHHELWHI
jgi:transposase